MFTGLKKLIHSYISDDNQESKADLDESEYELKPQKKKDNQDEPGV
jgi:hypothetical protein